MFITKTERLETELSDRYFKFMIMTKFLNSPQKRLTMEFKINSNLLNENGETVISNIRYFKKQSL